MAQAHFITNLINIRYLSGFSGSSALMILTGRKKYLITDFRYRKVILTLPNHVTAIVSTDPYKDIQKIIKKHKINTFLFEENHLSVARLKLLKQKLNNIKFKEGNNYLEALRIKKTSHEINLIKRAQRITEKAYKQGLNQIKTGITERELAFIIESEAMKLGAEAVAFPPIVAFGNNTGSPHHQTSNRKLKKADMILIDIGFKYQGYCSDMTRTLFTAKPNTNQEKIYQTVLQAQLKTINNLKAGMAGSQADNLARKIIDDAGYGTEFGHSLGHGVGLEAHEAPYLSINYRSPIPLNAVVTVEPGIYLENSFGVRIEDMVLVERNKVKNLNRIPKQIKDLILTIS